VTRTYLKTCAACKGRGYHVRYVDEWAELAARLHAFVRRLLGR
jgi:hypothetical protein